MTSPYRITQTAFEASGGHILLETTVSAPQIMTWSANDAPGLNKMHNEALEETIRKTAPQRADAYFLGEGTSGERRLFGIGAVITDVTYPVTHVMLQEYLG
ncbi:MAG: hypothetical protein ABIJ21_00395 [Nanoarchaeota archaeon]